MKTEYFELYELVSEEAYATMTERVMWRMFDDRILGVADMLRKRYGAMTCNDWYWGGKWHGRGLRMEVGTSQHCFGRALDLIPLSVSVDKIREDINRWPWVFPGINAMEISSETKTVNWLHVDCRNLRADQKRVFSFAP